MLRHELAHDEDRACESQEEPAINGSAEGNAGGEPRQRCAIQQEVAEADQPRASRGRRSQPLEEPGAEHKHHRACAIKVAPGQRLKQRYQASSQEPQTGQCLTPLNEVAEDDGIGHNEPLHDGDEEAWQVATPDCGTKQPSELSRERAQEDLIDTGEEPRVTDEELEASQRHVWGLDGSLWKMHMRFALNRW